MLKSAILFDTTVATLYGNAEFDHNGVSNNLTIEAQKALDAVPYLTYVADEKPVEKEVKEEKKEEKPKKAPAKKAPKKKKVKE